MEMIGMMQALVETRIAYWVGAAIGLWFVSLLWT